jgi:hypothetical protein
MGRPQWHFAGGGGWEAPPFPSKFSISGPIGAIHLLGAFQRKREKIDMAALWLLSVEAAIEGATGLALIIFPQAVSSLLLGAVLAAAGIAVARVAGIALLSLGLVCWMSRQDGNKTAALAAMLNYNLLVTAYLMYLGLGGVLVGSTLS